MEQNPIIAYNRMLTEKQFDAIKSYATKISWGFTPNGIRKQLERYQKGTELTKAKVCSLLEECNYHELCKLLAKRDIEAAIKWCNDVMPLEIR